MEPLAYVFVAVAVIAGAVLLRIDLRRQHRTRKAVNDFLHGSNCPSCSGTFQNWTGQVSSNHYQFVDLEIPSVLCATCSKCGETTDIFHYTDERMELSPLRYRRR